VPTIDWRAAASPHGTADTLAAAPSIALQSVAGR
jgi:hypothetical protein